MVDFRDDTQPFNPAKLQVSDPEIAKTAKKSAVVEFPDYASSGPPSPEEQKVEIERLAGLSESDYENARNGIAARWGWRKSTLDRLVERARVKLRTADAWLASADREPSLERIEGDVLLNDLIADLCRYVSLQPDYAVIAVFWALHTYLLDSIPNTPRLYITAPEPGCGKSTLMDWLATVVQKPLKSDNVSAAGVFHIVEKQRPTLLIDEADSFLHLADELRGVLNSGHSPAGVTHRWNQKRENLVAYKTYAACAISLLGNLPDTLRDRSIRIRLQKHRPDEKLASLRIGAKSDLPGQCARWALDNHQFISDEPAIPKQLHGRTADNWSPLLAIADAIGEPWPEKLRAIALQIVALEAGEELSPGTQLLSDVREILGDKQWISSDALQRALPISGKKLATMLKPYGIEPRQQRVGRRVERGYRAEDFADAFVRYLVPDVPDVPPASEVARVRAEGIGTSGTRGTARKKGRTR
jgi:putative DNA primase/helicase